MKTKAKKDNSELIDSLIERFDFKSCIRALKAYDWELEVGKIDSIEEMKDICVRLIGNLLEDPNAESSSTSCFCAYREEGVIALRMQLGDVFEEEKSTKQ